MRTSEASFTLVITPYVGTFIDIYHMGQALSSNKPRRR